LDELRVSNADTTTKVDQAKQSADSPTKQPVDTASATDFSKLDVRVGIITKAWEHPEADKLYCEEIDIGEDQPRQIASGLRAHYKLEELQGQRVLVLSNLKARRLVGFASHGMVLCASANDIVKFVEPPEGAAIGERVTVERYDGEPATENQVLKKKMIESIFPDLATNAAGIATYKGLPLSTSAGPCRSTLVNAEIA
jgi:methionine--tRNA ligase beta chain